MAEHDDISKLLRLKRYEQPPPVYFETFVREFHRRQRTEMMKRSFLQSLWDRAIAIAPNFQVPKYAYATIAVLALSVSALIVTQQAEEPAMVAAAPQVISTGTPAMSLSLSKPVTIGDTIPVSATTLPPHYVLQPRPVSNEQPLSF